MHFRRQDIEYSSIQYSSKIHLARWSVLSARVGVVPYTRAHQPVHTPECNGARECLYELVGHLRGRGRGPGRDHARTRPRALHSAGGCVHALSITPSEHMTRLTANHAVRT